MWALIRQIRSILGTLLMMAFVALALSASAQQRPTPDNPIANEVHEQQLLDQLHRIQGRGSIPDVKSYVLEQPAGRLWETYHEVYLHWIAAIAIFGIFFLLAAYYLWHGSIRFGKRSGKTMQRFTAFERFVHWMTTVCFVTLALSGLNITFGKKLILPLVGPDAFSTLAQFAKYSHNYLSFPFTLGVVLMFILWIASNLPTRADVEWMKQGGGMFGGGEPPAWKFNAGEKLIFWIVVTGGALAAASGYVLLFPFYGTTVANMQMAEIAHSTVGMLYIASMLVHTYMGTLGTEGAFESMVSGKVDTNWAKVHHSLWYEQEVAKQRPVAAPPAKGASQTA